MRLNKRDIPAYFDRSEYTLGLKCFEDGMVYNYNEVLVNGLYTVSCSVMDKKTYYVCLLFDKYEGLSASCTCSKFASNFSCEHVAAAAFAFADYKPNQKDTFPQTDVRASKLLNAYLRQSDNIVLGEKAHLSPYIYYYKDGAYPLISLKVGRERMYVVKDIARFLEMFNRGDVLDYGKQLTLKHEMSEFDSGSQELIKLLMNNFYDNSYSRFDYYNRDYTQKQTIALTGYDFDRFFDLYNGQTVMFHDSKNKGLLFTEKDPKLKIKFSKGEKSTKLIIDKDDNPSVFGNKTSMYAIYNGELMRCSPDFAKSIGPLVQSRSTYNDTMVISDKDMPTFCSCVLPEIENYVDIEGDEGIFSEFIPDECTTNFYFDMEPESNFLSAEIKFKYNDVLIDKNKKPKKEVKRNLKVETAARSVIESIFGAPEPDNKYRIYDEDKIYDFLTEQINQLYSYGDIYISNRLKAKEIKPKQLSMGVSVSNGIINLDFDMGEFPFDELEELYQSLLQKKKYHKLKDGRFLTLDGSPYETMAEFAHMTQLNEDELKNGHASLPAFRALYLDGIMNGSEDILVERDKSFKSMIRSFKTVSDSDYVIPEKQRSTLRSYQKTGYRWLKTLDSCHFGGILADDMGLGKTLQVITYLSSVYESEEKPSIIICPSSLVLNWADEFDKFAPDMKYRLITGTPKVRKELIGSDNSATILITSYDSLKKDIESYTDISFYACVLDEGQYIKNRSTLASKSVKRIDCVQRFVLTGTPIENRLGELWNLFDYLMPGYLFNYNQFSQKLEKPIIKSGDASAQKQLKKMIQPFVLRRLKSEVLKELPPKIEYVHKIQLSEEERKVYAASALQAKNTEYKGKLEILAALTRLRQICCDPNLCFDNYKGEESKLDACLRLCREAVDGGHQVLLFSQFTSMLDIIREKLNEEKISNFTIQGSTPKEKRSQLVKSFNNHGADIFLISLKAGGTGLNLTAADVVIHYDPWWNLAAQNQATDRAHRIGQKSSVSIYKLIAKNTIEEKILELQEKKASLMDVISDDADQNIMNMTQQELLDLL